MVAVFRHLLSKVLCVMGKVLSNLPVSTCGVCSQDDSGFVGVGSGFVGIGICLFVGFGI